MHTETLLNPFFVPDYACADDGQDFKVFTQIKADQVPMQGLKGEIDAIEDQLLDDFSFDTESEGQMSGDEEDIISRHSSVDSNSSSFSIRRQKGKRLMASHTNGCLDMLSIKLDQVVS